MSERPDPVLRGLLLRRLPQPEVERLEERILLEDDWGERLRETEYDLLDDYAAGRLDPADREAVERVLLDTADGRRRALLAQALVRAGRARRPARRGWLAPAAALLAASVLLAVLWPLFRPAAPGGGPAPMPAPVARATPAATRALPPDAAPVPTLLLLADNVRGATASSSATPFAPGSGTFRLQLESPEGAAAAGGTGTGTGVGTGTGAGDARRYQIAILDVAGGRRFLASGLQARSVGAYRIVEALVPASALGPDSRRVVLSASSGVVLFTWSLPAPPR